MTGIVYTSKEIRIIEVRNKQIVLFSLFLIEYYGHFNSKAKAFPGA